MAPIELEGQPAGRHEVSEPGIEPEPKKLKRHLDTDSAHRQCFGGKAESDTAPAELRDDPSEAADGLEAELPALASALHRFGLSDSPDGMDACWRSPDGSYATVWKKMPVPVSGLRGAYGAILSSMPQANIVLRVRTACAKAVSQRPEGLRPLAQGGILFYEAVAVAAGAGDAAQALAETPGATVLLVRGEGAFYVFSASVGTAFTLSYYLDKACRRQLLVGARPVCDPGAEIWAHAKAQMENPDYAAGVEWPAVKASVMAESLSADEPPKDGTGDGNVQEQELRESLCAMHKELNRRGLDELVWNHCSAKLGGHLFFTPGNRLWDGLEPQHLTVDESVGNSTAKILHQAIYDAVPTCTSVAHTHSIAMEAVSCFSEGFVPSPDSAFAGRVAYHDWAGFSDDAGECKHIVAAIHQVPDCAAIVLRNHGVITWGSSIAEALERHLAFDAECCQSLLESAEASVALDELRANPHWRECVAWSEGARAEA